MVVSDLYAMKFKAKRAMKEDITGAVKNPEHFHYDEEKKVSEGKNPVKP